MEDGIINSIHVPGDDIMCPIIPHCVQSYRTVYNLTALGALKGGGMGPETSHVLYQATTEPLS